MINETIKIAKDHDIYLHHGMANEAMGDCAFESCLDSVNFLDYFTENYGGSVQFYRWKWMSEVERIGFNSWNLGLTKSEWTTGWDYLKQPMKYEHALGDLIVPGIAHCLQKDILIINTSPRAYSPIYVIEAQTLNGQNANTKFPIVLAYDQTHYEMMVPDSDLDLLKLVLLKEDFVKGKYERPCSRKHVQPADNINIKENRDFITFADIVKNVTKILFLVQTKSVILTLSKRTLKSTLSVVEKSVRRRSRH